MPGRDIGVSAYLIARLVSIASRARGIASLWCKESEEVALARDGSETKGKSPMDSQKIYLLAELTFRSASALVSISPCPL